MTYTSLFCKYTLMTNGYLIYKNWSLNCQNTTQIKKFTTAITSSIMFDKVRAIITDCVIIDTCFIFTYIYIYMNKLNPNLSHTENCYYSYLDNCYTESI